jgi:hypothetical protein
MSIRKENARNFGWHCLYLFYFLLFGTAPIHFLISNHICEPDKLDVFVYLYPPLIFLVAFFNMFSKRKWNGNVFIFMFTKTEEDLSFDLKDEDEYGNAFMWCVGILLPVTMLGFTAADCILNKHGVFYKYYWLWVILGILVSWSITWLVAKKLFEDKVKMIFNLIVIGLLTWWTVTVVMDLMVMVIYSPQIFIGFFR